MGRPAPTPGQVRVIRPYNPILYSYFRPPGDQFTRPGFWSMHTSQKTSRRDFITSFPPRSLNLTAGASERESIAKPNRGPPRDTTR
ncbi:hypothetical protein B0T17DRAFT_541901 [Bombardia bombarda]|uniref:Uncharacterized protein n=1 Tax=Bombardia bombarda TaxID=252184 RepID=A0AA39T2I0_9PEZI|nr:hypothetical protein B0T17DRAFT_541901 [Bombardia bombarda]